MKSLVFFLIVIFGFLLLSSCDTEPSAKLALVTTNEVQGISHDFAVAGGDVVEDGGGKIKVRGVCWGININPTIDSDSIVCGRDLGNFECDLNDLTPSTQYYLRAYAINEAGVSYGNEVTFTTNPAPSLPVVLTNPISSISFNSASGGGAVTFNGNLDVIQRGVCWSSTTNPTISQNFSNNGVGIGEFSSSITGLSPSTRYYVRAYAINSLGISYGEQVEFTTLPVTATILANKDATIFNNALGNSANGNYGAGGSELLQIGYAAPTQLYARALLYFDLTSIPAGAVIESASLEFTQASSGTATSYEISIFTLTESWVEGNTSFCTYNSSCNIQGLSIVNGSADVTWNEKSYSGSNMNGWSTLGGTFANDVIAVKQAGTTTPGSNYSFSSEGIKGDIQNWVNNPSLNFGWILKTEFITTNSAMKRFYSREGALASGNINNSPRLIINYH